MGRNVLPIIALVALAVVLAITLAGQADANAATRCALPRGSSVIAKHRSAVVYVGRHANGGHDYFACSRLNGRRSRLGFVGDEICAGWDDIAHFHFVGPFLAFVRSGSDCVGESSYDQLARIDLRSGARTIFHASEFENSQVLTLRLRSDGALAWLAEVGETERDSMLELWGAGPAGRAQVLDRADDAHAIARASLVLSPAGLSWTKAGAPAAAAL